MFRSSVVLFCALVARIVTGAYPTSDETCFGLDISTEPKLEARKIDGWWFHHRISKEALDIGLANSIFLLQFQGRTAWALDWDTKTQSCTYRKFKESQKQSVTVGPFLPCWIERQVLPIEESTTIEYLYWVPTDNLFVYYTCIGELRGRNCLGQPFVGVLTRTLYISRKELNMVRRKLRRLGIPLGTLAVVNPRENRCPLPMTAFNRPNESQSRNKYYRY